MRQATFLKFLVIPALLPLAGLESLRAEPEKAAGRPNVIFILSDDQGYGDFGCYGSPYLKTPNMDRLYRESTRVPNFYMGPACTPSRASLMTGRDNYRTSVWNTWQGGLNMREDEFTVAEAFQQAGYRTALFGKWHLGYNYPFRPEDQGFDEVLLFDMFHKPANNRKDPVMIHNGRFVETKGFQDDVVFDYAIDYLRATREDDAPFFMFVASLLPHTWMDYQVPPEYVEKFKQFPELNNFNAEILAMVEKLDENIGRLLDELDVLGLSSNTIVIFTSDNGPEHHADQPRFNTGLRGSKNSVYEGGIKVPFFVRWPGVLPAGQDISQVGVCTDFMPTLLEMCDIRAPLPNPVDGISLWPHLSGQEKTPVPRTFACQFHRPDTLSTWDNCYIRDGDYKLVNGAELYDLAADPAEQNDLAERQPQKVEQLRAKYAAWFDDVTARTAKDGEFVIHPIRIGTEQQRLTNLRYSNKSPKHGWPMEIVSPGPYRITVQQMQNDLFDETSQFELVFGSQIVNKAILPNDGVLVFDNVMLKPGRVNFRPEIAGTHVERIFRDKADVGHRNIHIEWLGQATSRAKK
jgi:arylsulfatase A-like enzyme